MGKLNIDSFNEILLGAMKEGYGEKELLEAEMAAIADMVMDLNGKLLDELEEKGYESDIFTMIKNIKNNTEHILERLLELEGEENEESI